MLDSELETFQKNFKTLQQKALNFLILKEWAHLIDKDAVINMPIINEYEVHFELVHRMIGRLLATKSLTWKEINALEEGK